MYVISVISSFITVFSNNCKRNLVSIKITNGDNLFSILIEKKSYKFYYEMLPLFYMFRTKMNFTFIALSIPFLKEFRVHIPTVKLSIATRYKKGNGFLLHFLG